MLGISNEQVATIEQFVEEQGLTFPVLHDNSSVYYDYFLTGGISPYPRDFIIDQQGIIQYASTEYEVQTIHGVIQSLLETTGIPDQDNPEQPDQFSVAQNYPNPFNSQTIIPINLPAPGPVKAIVYNINGQAIQTLHSGHLPAGKYYMEWDGTNQAGTDAPSGVYFLRVHSGNVEQTNKLLLIR